MEAVNVFRVCAVLTLFATVNLAGAQSKVYNIDDTPGHGRRFDGIGAISGGGATSKLLVNYPTQQRNEILDFLFKPNYGASLHILKVEIGGDGQTTDGTESSHMHESWEENYQRGYEWWLMVEAKKRNPDILLYGLPWSFPAWIGNGTFSAYANPEVTAEYIIKWINGAQTYYNLKLDYIGIWNERNYSSIYIKTLRKALDQKGLDHVRICAPDDLGWQIAGDIMVDKELAAAVDFIGTHYPKSLSSVEAVNTGKQLWSSEDQAACHARTLNQNYVTGMMTATITWNLLASYYEGLPYYRAGLMTASEPWSGSYTVDSHVWETAHTTQFTKPGWRYLSHGSGVGNLTGGGSYVTFTDTITNDLTIVIETSTCSPGNSVEDSSYGKMVPQTATFKFSGTFNQRTVFNVWYSRFDKTGDESNFFVQRDPIQVVDGEITLTLGVNEVYTITTLSRGQKGSAPVPPPSQHFPLPYGDNFDALVSPMEPYNLAQQVGVWEALQVGPPHGGIIRQMVTEHPVFWCWGGTYPQSRTINVAGNYYWTDIYIQIDVNIGGAKNNTDGAFVAARIDRGGCHASLALGIFFFIYPGKQQYILTADLAGTKVLISGTTTMSRHYWNTIGLSVQGNSAVGIVNGRALFNATIPDSPANGFVGIGTDPYGLADFDNLEILTVDDAWNRNKFDDETLYYQSQTED